MLFDALIPPLFLMLIAHHHTSTHIHICFQSSFSSSQHDVLVKPAISENNFGFETNENSLSPIVGKSQSADNSQPPVQVEGNIQHEQLDQPDFQHVFLHSFAY